MDNNNNTLIKKEDILNISNSPELDFNDIKYKLRTIYQKYFIFMDPATGKLFNLPFHLDDDMKKIVIYSKDVTKRYTKQEKIAMQQPKGNEVNKQMATFFVKSIKLNNAHKELLELREKYFKELSELENKQGGCSQCQKGALMRKYIPLIEKYFKEVRDANSSNISITR